jgi:hypothetical protein
MIKFTFIVGEVDDDGNYLEVCPQLPMLVNPDHIVMIRPHERHAHWCKVELIDDYTVTVTGTVDEILQMMEDKYALRT